MAVHMSLYILAALQIRTVCLHKSVWALCKHATTGAALGADLSICDVEGGHRLHVDLGGMLGGMLLGIIGAIEVLASDGALAASHVTPNDEVRAACKGRRAFPL